MKGFVDAAFGAAMGVCVLAMVGCAGADTSAGSTVPEGEVLGTASSSLSNGSIQWVNGTYTNCVNHTGSWSARVSGVATMTNGALTVVKNDTTCVLSMTGIYADQLYGATPALALGTSFAAVASSFGSGAAQFSANARLDSVQFAADFQLSLVYGDTTTAPTSVVVNSAYATVQASTVTTGVSPPNYTIDTSSFLFQIDAIGLVTGVSGSAQLTNGTNTGTTYAIDMGTLPASPTYLQVGVAWITAVTTQKPITGANPAVPSSQFGVLGLNLLSSSQVRTLIVQRTVAGVSAYQLFRITFSM